MWLWCFLLFLISAPESEIQGWEHSLIWQKCSQLKYINIYDIFTDCENADCTLLGVSLQWDLIWSISAPLECHLPVTTLVRLLLPGILTIATKRAKPQHITAAVTSHSGWIQNSDRGRVLWEASVRTAWFFLVFVLMWHHFFCPLLRKKTVPHTLPNCN